MSHFTYTAERAGGEVYRGAVDAADRFEVYGVIRQEGGRLLSLEEGDYESLWSLARWGAILSRVSEYEKILFARNLGAMLSAGLSLARALAVLGREGKNAKVAMVVSSIASDVRRGEALNAALAKFPAVFPKLFVAMVRSGEEGGDLAQSLLVIADQTERMYSLKKKIRGALIYPSIILAAIVGIGAVMMIEVVPTLAATFREMNVDLPPQTRIVIGVSDFLVQYTFLAVGALVALVAGVYFAARTARGGRFFDALFLHTPLIGGIVREVNAARTARTLSSLLSSGVAVLSALDIAGDVIQNSYFKEVIRAASKGVGSGEPLSAAFARREDLYPAFVGEMMAVGEETGQLAEMLKRLALFYEEEVDRRTKDMSTVIEPFLMIVIGAAVGFFAISMITPIYSLSQNI